MAVPRLHAVLIASLFLGTAPAVLCTGRNSLPSNAVTSSTPVNLTPGKTTPVPSASLIGSGLEVRFPGTPGQSYCLLSDPCIHVNALLEGVSTSPWVSGYAVKAGQHTVSIKGTKAEEGGVKAGDNRVVLDREEYNTVVTLNDEPVHSIIDDNRVAETRDEEIAIELWNPVRKEILVTAKKCHVRLLFRVQEGKDVPYPILSVDVLDWDSLQAPHGIIGQTFPNRANPEVIVSRTRRAFHSSSNNGEGDRVPGALWSLPTVAAMKMAKNVKVRSVELDGVPEDYLSSGFAEADCVFSRFEHEWKEQKTGQKLQLVHFDEHGAAVKK